MNTTAIREKYFRAIDRHGLMLSADACMLLLDLALDDAVAAAGSPSPSPVTGLDDYGALLLDASYRLGAWLEENHPDIFAACEDGTYPTQADAALAVIKRQHAELRKTVVELGAAIGERDAAARAVMPLEAKCEQFDAQLIQLDADNAKLLREINRLRGEYKPERFADLANWLTVNGILDGEQPVIETAITVLQSQRAEISRLTEELAVLRQLHPSGNGAGLLRDFDGVVVNPPAAARARTQDAAHPHRHRRHAGPCTLAAQRAAAPHPCPRGCPTRQSAGVQPAMTTNDTHAAALTAAEVADLADRLRYILDITPAQASFVRPIHRRMAVQLYRCLCAYSALLMPKEE